MQPLKMVDLANQHLQIKSELDRAISEVLEHTLFINGPEVNQFKLSFSSYLSSPFVIPCANGTDALQLAIMVLELPLGSEIIVPTFSYIAAAEAISILGHVPVFVDAESASFNIDCTKIEEKITKNTKVIIPVHLFGQGCDMEKIMDIAAKYSLFVIEDNAQSIGAEYYFKNGTKKKLGTIGDIGTTSFFPSKILGCMGDGGAVFTNDVKLSEKLTMLANHGQKERYKHQTVGINSRLDTIQAAVLHVKLKHLDGYIASRIEAAQKYNQEFENCELIKTPARVAFSSHSYHQYCIKVTNGKRDFLKNKLDDLQVPTMIYYPIPIHLQKAFSYLGYKKGDFPVSEDLVDQIIALPIHTELSTEQISYISKQVIENCE